MLTAAATGVPTAAYAQRRILCGTRHSVYIHDHQQPRRRRCGGCFNARDSRTTVKIVSPIAAESFTEPGTCPPYNSRHANYFRVLTRLHHLVCSKLQQLHRAGERHVAADESSRKGSSTDLHFDHRHALTPAKPKSWKQRQPTEHVQAAALPWHILSSQDIGSRLHFICQTQDHTGTSTVPSQGK
jgi:hypothetical protein